MADDSQHTLGHIQCPACEALRKFVVMTGELAHCSFAQVWPLWIQEKSQLVSEKTLRCWGEYYRALHPFFGALLLRDIHIGNIVAYREQRQLRAGPSLINHEINALKQIMERSGLWAPIAKFYKPLRIPKSGPGQALLEEEALWLLERARSRPKWRVAYLASLLSANTACGPGEIRKLRIKDVDLSEPVINIVQGAKNDYRVRPVPLNMDALWAVKNLLELATTKGAHLPDHYLLPHRAHVKGAQPDPTRPMGSWKKAWYSLRAEAGKRYPKLATIRMYDLRHHALTSLLENPSVSEQTIKDIAGHVSKKILERYSHIRLARKKAALEALEGLRKPVTPEKKQPQAAEVFDDRPIKGWLN